MHAPHLPCTVSREENTIEEDVQSCMGSAKLMVARRNALLMAARKRHGDDRCSYKRVISESFADATVELSGCSKSVQRENRFSTHGPLRICIVDGCFRKVKSYDVCYKHANNSSMAPNSIGAGSASTYNNRLHLHSVHQQLLNVPCNCCIMRK